VTRGPASATPPDERREGITRKTGWFRYAEAADRQRPVPPDGVEIADLRGRDRLLFNEVRAIWHANIGPIRTPQVAAIHADMHEIFGAARQDGHKVKPAMVIDAPPGLGKTTVVKAFGKDVHREQIELRGDETAAGNLHVPVGYVSLSSNTTRRGFSSAVAGFYEHPGADSGNADRIGNRAANCMISTGTRLMIIDDVHFLELRSKAGRDIANHFKWIANTFPVTLLLVGVDLRKRGLFDDPQTARRWTPLDMTPLEVETEQGRRSWRSLLKAIEKELVLTNLTPGMLAEDLSDYLFARSSGHFSSLMTLIERGCYRAVRTGEERLTEALMDQVKNDAAAEAVRRELAAAFAKGRLTSRPTKAAAA